MRGGPAHAAALDEDRTACAVCGRDEELADGVGPELVDEGIDVVRRAQQGHACGPTRSAIWRIHARKRATFAWPGASPTTTRSFRSGTRA